MYAAQARTNTTDAGNIELNTHIYGVYEVSIYIWSVSHLRSAPSDSLIHSTQHLGALHQRGQRQGHQERHDGDHGVEVGSVHVLSCKQTPKPQGDQTTNRKKESTDNSPRVCLRTVRWANKGAAPQQKHRQTPTTENSGRRRASTNVFPGE